MSNLALPWSSHQEMIVTDPGPWIIKEATPAVLAYCPNCRTYPQPKFGHYEQGEISCFCHTTRAELVELKLPVELDPKLPVELEPLRREEDQSR